MISTGLFRAVILLEIAYLYLRTELMHSGYFHNLTVIEQELARSVVRAVILAGVLVACWHFKSFPGFTSKPRFNRPTLVLVIALLIQTLLEQSHEVTGLYAQLTFAATTILVAIREELVYRYVLQNWLQDWFSPKNGLAGSIFFTSVLFTFYHIGAQPLSSLPDIFFSGILLGGIYIFSGKSLSLVIICHFICDLFFI
jgi:membrane protease YdiL (CAAX protease family)